MSTIKSYEKDQLIFREGDFEMCMYKVVSGKVGIYKEYQSEDETLLTELETGRIFGEMGLIDYMPRSATALALEDSQIEVISDEEFEDYLNNNIEEMFFILDSISSRTRELTDGYEQICADLGEFAKAEGVTVAPALLDRIHAFAKIGKKHLHR